MNNPHQQFLIQQALDRIQELCLCIDHMFLWWENRINIYIELLNQKIQLVEQERSTLINIREHIYGIFIDLYEFDNYLYLYKKIMIIHKILKKIKAFLSNFAYKKIK